MPLSLAVRRFGCRCTHARAAVAIGYSVYVLCDDSKLYFHLVNTFVIQHAISPSCSERQKQNKQEVMKSRAMALCLYVCLVKSRCYCDR